ncbi:MAG: FtsW/RodA/SpoVE family cell cycle protein, partial [Planctomycetota bacterium]|nr:FtsW/RodA/SpoVE family cell cycle protein [Planctomycetota bacterium]
MRHIDFWKLDWIFLLVALAIVVLGLPFLYSSAGGDYFRRQLVWLVFGLATLVVFLMFDFHLWTDRAYWIYAAALAFLVLVLFATPINNARSYLRFGSVGMQPAELFKLALILALAHHLGKRDNQHLLHGLVIPFILTLGPLFLILKQPDLGTALTIPPILFAMLWASGARLLHLLSALGLGLASLWPLWEYGMHTYQKSRIYAFLTPEL